MADRKLIVEIVGDSRSLDRAFKKSSAAADGFGHKMATIGKIAAAGFAGVAVGIGLFLRKGFRELMDSQKVMAQTAAVIKSTGGAAQVSAAHVDRLASSLSRMTGIDDEVIGAGENMLLTFTNIRNGLGKAPKVFDMATKAVLDLSVATGKDMTTAAVMVGKALNDTNLNAKGTITGWSALRRVGVNISPMLMKQAAGFIKAGKPVRAQLLLLKELQTEFGGSAKAFGATLPGAFAKFRNATDELAGAFAKGLAPVVQRVANLLTKKMADPKFRAYIQHLGHVIGVNLLNAFLAVSAWFKANWPAIKSGFRSAADLAERLYNMVKKFVDALYKVGDFIGKFGWASGNKSLQQQALMKAYQMGGPAAASKLAQQKGWVNVQGDIHVHGVQDEKKLAETIHRHSKKHASRTRGRHQTPLLGHH